LISLRLWNTHDEFYETVPRSAANGWSGTREVIGYIPWYFDIPSPHFDREWKFLFDPTGFAGTYGPTTAERRSPRFNFTAPHACLWNGPSWPFATPQTLVALANLLNGPPQSVIGPREYRDVLADYVRAQHLQIANGKIIPWVDEDLDPDTGQWIARTILEREKTTAGESRALLQSFRLRRSDHYGIGRRTPCYREFTYDSPACDESVAMVCPR